MLKTQRKHKPSLRKHVISIKQTKKHIKDRVKSKKKKKKMKERLKREYLKAKALRLIFLPFPSVKSITNQ